MAIIFNGREFAAKKMEKLDKEVAKLKNRGIHPRLASILIGDDPASKLYVSLKKKKAEEMGAEMDIYFLRESEPLENILCLIESLNKDELVTGIMVQLPLPEWLKSNKEKIIESIDFKKDVDGLKNNSRFLHPTSMAVIQIINEAKKQLKINGKLTACVVGSTGMVGTPLVSELKKEGYEVIECHGDTKDLKEKTIRADILISTTGTEKLIKGDMVKEGTIVVDVGSPKGDVDFESVYTKTSFITPVPGGVGPVTIACLLENLIIASRKSV